MTNIIMLVILAALIQAFRKLPMRNQIHKCHLIRIAEKEMDIFDEFEKYSRQGNREKQSEYLIKILEHLKSQSIKKSIIDNDDTSNPYMTEN